MEFVFLEILRFAFAKLRITKTASFQTLRRILEEFTKKQIYKFAILRHSEQSEESKKNLQKSKFVNL